ncbi:hypothetical protein [Actinophytocola sp.]|uniref:hypothetical protein n=1 Tax=Actinophytocola sp. TaxID=1872138 RepID=UPI00389AB194
MSHGSHRRVAIAGLTAVALVIAGCDGGEELPRLAGDPSPAASRGDEAARFAPLVWLAAGDEHGPMDASRFVAESKLLFHRACQRSSATQQVATEVDERKLGGRDAPYTAQECGATVASDSYTGTDESQGFYLDLDDGEDARRGAGPSAPVYWQYYEKGDGSTSAFVYWLFYGYNDAFNNHEGDWERVAVQLVDGEPDGVTFWKHEEPPCRVAWSDIDRRDGHPVTYSAAGSHGSYPWEGGYDATPYGPAEAQPVTDVTSPGTPWSTWNAARSVVEQPWWGYRGRWGDQTGLPGANGPRGPHPDRQEAVFATEPCAPPLPDPTATPGPSVPQDEPTGPAIPDAFLDQWQAPEPMSRPGLPRPYYVRLQLWGEDQPGADSFEGLSEYNEDFGATPGISELACSGDLDLVEASADKLVFAETERFDTYENCPDKGTVTVTLSGDQLVYDYVGDGGSAHTVLVRS